MMDPMSLQEIAEAVPPLVPEAAKQVPGLVALVLVVKWGMIHQRQTGERLLKHDEERDKRLAATFEKISADFHAALRESNELMREVAKELGASRQATTELRDAVRGLGARPVP